ncbi:MAG: DUF89 family protein [Candidatus Goldbacteria bacterium]|nr:DUF89 family protein [Candidatus Goldiibacteriota bacterium]
MKTFPECLSCFIRQSIQAAKFAGRPEKEQKEIVDKIEKYLKNINLEDTPPKISRNMHILIKKILKNEDPYKIIKDKYNNIALSMYEDLKERVKKSEDKFETALRIAIAGNIIDFGAQVEFELEQDMHEVLTKNFAIFHFKELKEKLSKEKEILYLGDNTGETVFDRVFMEEIKSGYGSEITYAVKEKPIINDATREDAVFAGIDKVARIVSTGCDSPGIVPEYCSSDFLKLYKNAKVVVAKGQGNFEALEQEKRPIFFLFKVKCNVVAGYLGVPKESIILYNNVRY